MSQVVIDPITFEILSHRLWQIAQEMGSAVTRVSGSPIAVESKDLMVGIYDGDGNLAVTGIGQTFSPSVFQPAIKHIIKTYSNNVGIYDGDAFMINDPYICALHKPDVAVVTPIFHQGELSAWAGAMTHVTDVGSMDPGGMSPRAREIYQEGFNCRGVKVVEKGQLRNDVLDSICSMSRDSDLLALDLRGQIASGDVARRRLLEIIEEHGVEVFTRLLHSLIEESEMKLKRRLRELPDGQWRTTEFIDSDAMTDEVYRIELKLIKRGDEILFDFTGTSKQAPTFINCAAPGLKGAVFGAVSTRLAYDASWNQGLMNCYQIKCPDGLVVNCRFPAPLGLGGLGAITYVFKATSHVISKMLSCSDQYRNDATGLWGPVGGSTVLTSNSTEAQMGVYMAMDTASMGGGARVYSDGLDMGGHDMGLYTAIPNVERYEALFPLLYLFRRQARDSGGAGEYRGGVGGASAITLHDFPHGALATMFGTSMKLPVALGTAGGYPGGNFTRWIVEGSDIEERFATGKSPQEIKELEGDFEEINTSGLYEIDPGDVIFMQWNGGGGYGDPLERKPDLVLRDVMNGLVSLGCAADVYGVMLNDDKASVDHDLTKRKRTEIKDKRAEEGTQTTIDIDLLANIEKLEDLSKNQRVKCEKCGSTLRCTDDKCACLSRRRSFKEISSAYAPNDDARFQEYYCPDCLTLLHVEVVA